LGYGVLHYIKKRRAGSGCGEVLFTYLGQFDQVLEEGWRGAGEPSGATRSNQSRRTHKLEVTASVMGGRLKWEWRYSRDLHQQETIANVAATCLKELKKLIAGSAEVESDGYLASDFGLSGLNQEQLAEVFAVVRNAGSEEEA
jgi:non-ribosomal peptide synthase protein (TIGR01720 family)